MPAALSPVPTPPMLRLGVWKAKRDQEGPPATEGAGSPDSESEASPATEWLAEWVLKRNCAMAPRQLLSVYVALSLLSLGIATLLWGIGGTYVLPFACLEVLLLGVALLMYGRHAADRDVIALGADVVHVERHTGGRLEAVDFNPRWVRVEPQRHDGSLVRLSGHGRTVDVGRFVAPGLRRQLAEEVRWALRQQGRRVLSS